MELIKLTVSSISKSCTNTETIEECVSFLVCHTEDVECFCFELVLVILDRAWTIVVVLPVLCGDDDSSTIIVLWHIVPDVVRSLNVLVDIVEDEQPFVICVKGEPLDDGRCNRL